MNVDVITIIETPMRRAMSAGNGRSGSMLGAKRYLRGK
jgi:hypothetical protein